MSTIIIGFIVLLNIFSIVLVYKVLGKIEINKKIITIVVAEVIMFALLQIMYSISSGNIPAEISNRSRTMLIFTFLPINMMTMCAPMARNFAKIKAEEIKKEVFKSKMTQLIVIDCIIIILETMYLNSIQAGIYRMIER